MFQSLFYWNLLSYIQVVCLDDLIEDVSILVLLEPPLILNPISLLGFKFKVSILVLLEPPLILDFTAVTTQSLTGFNPCFTGTSSHTPNYQLCRYCSDQFQSLFYWNLLSYYKPRPALKRADAVSILVLLEPPLIQNRRRRKL